MPFRIWDKENFIAFIKILKFRELFICFIWLYLEKCGIIIKMRIKVPFWQKEYNMEKPVYKRVLLKLSGEALAGDQRFGLNHEVIAPVVDQIVAIHNLGVQVGLVIGGGNFWRGRQGTNMDRTTADHMGMLATVMNSLAMMDAIEQRGVAVRVQTALDMVSLAEPFILRKALRHFEQGRVVIFACGTGNPYCSTDTAAALRACEIDADILLMAKNVDGIYDSDPKTNPFAKKYESLKYADIINQGLKVIDFTAATMCMENNVPTLAFGLNEENAIVRAVCGEKLGTLIHV
jgi:uridylate kinase